ncbi:VOC family protein [Nocardioides sp. LHG3406-4]|uniref:VOC family protein n=1 Tax=Nocardioides sp. LHG3406-4 TaxID=2804575 RepID=UPI003CEF6C21
MTETHHTISYVELNVRDLAAARAFYEQAFGWAFNDYGPDYAGIRAPSGEGEVGGLNAEREPSPGGPLVLLFSEDLDASVAAVEAAGGQVTEGPYDYPGGRRFHFTDPDGNGLGVYAH